MTALELTEAKSSGGVAVPEYDVHPTQWTFPFLEQGCAHR